MQKLLTTGRRAGTSGTRVMTTGRFSGTNGKSLAVTLGTCPQQARKRGTAFARAVPEGNLQRHPPWSWNGFSISDLFGSAKAA
jgi:hypothetical protein